MKRAQIRGLEDFDKNLEDFSNEYECGLSWKKKKKITFSEDDMSGENMIL